MLEAGRFGFQNRCFSKGCDCCLGINRILEEGIVNLKLNAATLLVFPFLWVQSSLAVTYRSVVMESELIVFGGGFNHVELVLGGEFDADFDFSENTLEVLNLKEQAIERILDFNDVSSSGVEIVTQASMDANDCDDGQAPPCTLPVSFVGNYFNINEGDAVLRGLFSLNKELFALVSGEGENFTFPDTEGDIEFVVGVDSPTTLAVADLNGTYDLYAHGQGFFHELNTGYSEEYAVNNNIEITFNGDGTCAASEDIYDAMQPYDWPSGNLKSNNSAERSFDNFESCSYSVDQPTGKVTLSVTLTDDEGEPDGFSLPLAVSSQYRYLTAWAFIEDSVTGEFDAENNVLVGVKRADQVDNTSLSGAYFFSAVSSTFTGPNEANTVTRSVITYSGESADTDGFSSCVRSVPVAVATAVHSASVNLFNDLQADGVVFCRYKVASNGKVLTQTSEDGVNWDSLEFEETTLSDNGDAIIGIVTDYGQNVAADSEVLLTQPSTASAALVVGLKYNVSAGSGPLTDFTRPFLSLEMVSPGLTGSGNDFDTDGDSDVLLRRSDNGVWRLFDFADGSVNGSSGLSLFLGDQWVHQANGDFDSDGDVDVLLRRSTDNSWRVFEIEDGAVIGSSTMSLFLNPLWQLEAVHDFDQDGDADILQRRTDTGQWRIFEIEDLNVVGSAEIFMFQNLEWELQEVADYDGDGDGDVLLRRSTTGQWRLFEIENRNLVGHSNISLFNGSPWSYVTSGDMDKDGTAEVVLRNSNGSWRVFDIADRAVTGSGSFNLFSNLLWQHAQTGDYDGDGDMDILLRRTDTGLWRFFEVENRVPQSNSQVNIWSNLNFGVRD